MTKFLSSKTIFWTHSQTKLLTRKTTHGIFHGSKNHTVLKVSTICRTNKCIFAKILGEYGIFQSILEPEIRPGFHISCCASTTFQHRFNFIGGEDLIPNIEVVYSPYITYTQWRFWDLLSQRQNSATLDYFACAQAFVALQKFTVSEEWIFPACRLPGETYVMTFFIVDYCRCTPVKNRKVLNIVVFRARKYISLWPLYLADVCLYPMDDSSYGRNFDLEKKKNKI